MVVVTGIVRDRMTGELLPWTLVFVGDNKGFTTESGEFEFVVPPGEYVCGMRHAYYEPLTIDVTIDGDKELEFNPVRARM